MVITYNPNKYESHFAILYAFIPLSKDGQSLSGQGDTLIEAKKTAIDTFGQPFPVFCLCQGITAVRLPKPATTHGGIHRLRNWGWVMHEIHAYSLPEVPEIVVSGQLDDAAPVVQSPIPRSLVTITHTVRVNSIRYPLRLVGVLLNLTRLEFMPK